MKIIVDIPKQDYIYITKKHCLPSCDERTLRNNYYEMILKGVPLPEGHGRLIDADDLDITTITTDDYSGNEVLDIVLKEDVDNASTIVEADKE